MRVDCYGIFYTLTCCTHQSTCRRRYYNNILSRTSLYTYAYVLSRLGHTRVYVFAKVSFSVICSRTRVFPSPPASSDAATLVVVIIVLPLHRRIERTERTYRRPLEVFFKRFILLLDRGVRRTPRPPVAQNDICVKAPVDHHSGSSRTRHVPGDRTKKIAFNKKTGNFCNGCVPSNPLCVESCGRLVTKCLRNAKKFYVSPLEGYPKANLSPGFLLLKGTCRSIRRTFTKNTC